MPGINAGSFRVKFYKMPCNVFNSTRGTIGDSGIGQREFRKVSLFGGNKLNLSCVLFVFPIPCN